MSAGKHQELHSVTSRSLYFTYGEVNENYFRAAQKPIKRLPIVHGSENHFRSAEKPVKHIGNADKTSECALSNEIPCLTPGWHKSANTEYITKSKGGICQGDDKIIWRGTRSSWGHWTIVVLTDCGQICPHLSPMDTIDFKAQIISSD